jgi:hypothetical protein
MNMPRFNWTGFPDLCEDPPDLVIAYQDFETWFRVRDALRALWGHHASGRRPRTVAWNLSLLESPDILKMAVRDSATAAAIVISAHGDSPLPGAVKSWLEQWSGSRTNETAVLVALFDTGLESQPPANETVAYLESLASAGHFECSVAFCDAKVHYLNSNPRLLHR